MNTIKKLHTHSDLPVASDTLATPAFIKRIVDEIKHSSPPKTLAITGYWGQGKTSALLAIYKELIGDLPSQYKNDENLEKTEHTGIWFEAWRYQHEEKPVVALLQVIRQAFSQKKKAWNASKKFLDVSFIAGLSVLDGAIKTCTGGAVTGLGGIKKVGEAYETENFLSQLPGDQISSAIEAAIKHLIGKKQQKNGKEQAKLIIFIDDLDRCEPAIALKLLEGIKLYLSLRNCVVIMAIDQRQLELLHQPDSSYAGAQYLEKLFQDVHRLPIPSDERRAEFLLTCLESLDVHLGEVLKQNLFDILLKYKCLPANPRRIKMYANRMAGFLRHDLNLKTTIHNQFSSADPIAIKAFEKLLVLVPILYVSYRFIYEQLDINTRFLEEILRFCKNPDCK